MVVNGSLSKTAVNGGAGARSQVSGLVVAGLTILTLLFLTGLFERLPQATLAAVVIAAVIELVDIAALTALWRIASRQLRGIYGIAARPDFIAAVAAVAGVLVFDTLPGLVIGVVVSLLLLLYRASRPHVAVLGQVPGMPGQYGDVLRHPENEQPPGSRCCGSRAGCSSPTPTPSATPSAPTPPRRGPGRSCSTPRPPPSSTSARPVCSSSSTRTSSGPASGWSSPATSARSATSCAGPRAGRPCPPPTRRSRTRSRPSPSPNHPDRGEARSPSSIGR